MSYQVLARKWRPRTFAELVGQEHVVTALANSLERGRLHHAYLLTGTRGVGKTTIARILAKSLNCITHGVTAQPCGQCAACTDIDAGRFVDLLELDAASNTGVDNMREILDNARYAPTVGRYKVYLIDEVHMLSKGAFNSMLKTLEEPPEHVKFVLATTDPQRVPVTVLSRCLQFNLKPLSAAKIAARIAAILDAEAIAHDEAALALLGRAAHGSLRDGLSLLDQAIAYGGGEVREVSVRTMLGAVERDYVYRIVDALAGGDGPALLREVDALAERGLAPGPALEELAALFHRMAIAQAVPSAAASYDDASRVSACASQFTPDTIQLCYQICAQGRADLALAPDEATGFAMTLLRLLAFEPVGEARAGDGSSGSHEPDPRGLKAPVADTKGRPPPAPKRAEQGAHAVADAPPLRVVGESPRVSTEAPGAAPVRRQLPDDASAWPGFVAGLALGGLAAQLAANSELRSIAGNVINLALPATHKHLADRAYSDKLKLALEQATGRKLLLAFEVGEITDSTLAAREKRERAEARAKTEAAFLAEPFVRELVERFDGKVKTDSIKPAGPAQGAS